MALARGRLDDTTLTDVRDVFVADAWVMGGPISGRAAFGPDGMICVTVGDHDRLFDTRARACQYERRQHEVAEGRRLAPSVPRRMRIVDNRRRSVSAASRHRTAPQS